MSCRDSADGLLNGVTLVPDARTYGLSKSRIAADNPLKCTG